MNRKLNMISGLAVCSALLAPSAGHAEFCVQLDAQFIGGRQQMAWGVGVPHHQQQQPLVDGFSVAAGHEAIEDTPAGEALKLMEGGEWVKAIQTIESLSDTQTLVRDSAGLLRPLSRLKTQLLMSMPDEGKRTFRRLNDAAAQNKLKQAQALASLEQRARGYLGVIRDYPLCDAAPSAAELLGDIRFEQGSFDEAAAMYRFTAERDAAKGDDPLLMARRLVSLSRAGQWQLFNDLADYARFRHPETELYLGGQATSLPNMIDQLAESRGQTHRTIDPGVNITLSVPNDDSELFERITVDKQTRKIIDAHAMKYNLSHVVPKMMAPIAVGDESGLFTLSMGVVSRRNPQTGTELWQQGDPTEHTNFLQARIGQLRSGYHPSLTLAGDRLIAGVPHESRPCHSVLRSFDAQTGELQWAWPAPDIANNEGVIGKPIVAGQTVYAVIKKLNDKPLRLVAVSLKDGKEIGSLDLGKAMINPNVGSIGLSPRLALGDNLLMVQTNNGALIAVDPATMTIAWAHEQQVRPPNPSELVWVARHAGSVLTHDGLVIAKDSRTNTLYAYREYDALPLWSTKTDQDAALVHVDDRHAYVLGKQLIAIELRTGKTAWWTPHQGQTAGRPIFTADACLIAGNQRRCRIDLQTGRLTEYQDSYGETADLTVAGQTLILIQDDRFRGYALPNNNE